MKTLPTNRHFFISLILIFVSFFILLFIAYQSLVFQTEVLSGQRVSEKIAQLNRIGHDYFKTLRESPPVPEIVFLPLTRPAFPDLVVPDNSKAREIFLNISSEPSMKQAYLVEAELNAPPAEQNFWRHLLLKEFLKSENFFALRQVAVQIIDSNFDFLLENGLTLKTSALLMVVKSFCLENNLEAAKQWLWRLREMPRPSSIPRTSESWVSLPKSLQPAMNFMVDCYKLSYVDEIKTGWYDKALVFMHKEGMAAFPAQLAIDNLHNRFIAAGFNDIASIGPYLDLHSSYKLNNAESVKVTFISPSSVQPVPGGFFLLIVITALATIGLFGFALHQWQLIQKAKLLDEEELFFRQTAHDLKTPITTVSFLAETIALRRYKSEEQFERYLNQLQNETARAAEIFDRLLLSARLRKKTVDPEKKLFSPENALNTIINRLKPRLPDWEIIQSYRNENPIFADLDMFERVMINLFENVIRHAAEGKQLTIISEDTLINGKKAVKIKVGDKGHNFPVQFENELNLLENALPYRPERGGSGTGLFLVKQIIQAHNGSFLVQKREKEGIWMLTTWSSTE